MQKKLNKKLLSLILSMMLIVAMAFNMTGCSGDAHKEPNTGTEVGQNTQMDSQLDETTVLGEGNTVFTFVVVDVDGNETTFEIHTDKTIVGEALLDVELIAGEESQYGLYVKTVNGITLDYDTDGKYWAFYVDGEYAMTGVDATTIEAGSYYSFKAE